MNINNIKLKICSLKGLKLKIKVNNGRNRFEHFEGFIDKILPNIFTVNTSKGIKSFSYTDVAIKQVEISKFN